MVIIIENGHNELSSNPVQVCLHLELYESNYSPSNYR